ncbi:MAG: 3-oxoacyl-[acyl-carrier protein] reductase [Candidatus Binatota bacterium]|nr:3-oxoacyl-[acyl-carrier protein] reductase [Candidatus Binatota bacterium]
MIDDLTGKVALVTGGSRGIGRAIAIALASAGCDVAVNYVSRGEDAAAARAEIEARGRRAIAVRADVSRGGEVTALVAAVEAELGPIAILVNNAGIARFQGIDEVTEEDWDEVLAVNLRSAFLVTRAVTPGMRSRGWGRIINVSSAAAQVGGVVGPHYAASKAGMIGLTHYCARHLAKHGVTANAIAPALIVTDMIAGQANVRPDLIPLGRFGEVDEVAEIAVGLARNGYVTGQTVNVDGGVYMT